MQNHIYLFQCCLPYSNDLKKFGVSKDKEFTIFQQFIQASNKENLKGLHYWRHSVKERNRLVTGRFPSQRASTAESVSLSWRHHNIWYKLVHISLMLACTCCWSNSPVVGDCAHPWASCQMRKTVDAHEPGMPGTFSPQARVSDPDMHHGTCVKHVPWCMRDR